MSDKKKLRVVGSEDAAPEKSEGCGEFLGELAKIEAQLISGEVAGLLVLVREASGETYPLVYEMGDLACVVGHLELAKTAIMLSNFAAGDDDDEND